MSTATTATTVGFPTLEATSTEANGTNDNGAGGPGRGASYFFGFLIAFIILLFLFVGCGLGTRRRLLARRRDQMLGQFGEGNWVYDWYNDEQRRATQPVWEEKWINTSEAPSATAISWAGMKPLAMTVLPPDVKSEFKTTDVAEKQPVGRSPTPPRDTLTPAPPISFPFQARIPHSLRRPHTTEDSLPSSPSPPPSLDPQSEALVTVIVSMPGSHSAGRSLEYEFGVARVPIKGNLS